MASASTVVAQKQQTLAQLIQQMRPEIGKALPRHLNPERMARIATTVVRQTPALAQCTPESFLGALLTASQLGLEPGPTGEAYLVPFGTVCTFIPGYRGLIKLARNSGLVSDIYAEIVYANDHYKVTRGLDRNIEHEEADGDRGKPTNVYAVAKFKDGERTFVTMTLGEVEAIRDRSKAKNNGPWVTDWEAMAKKTAVKQLSKWLPLSAEFNTAAVLDGSVRTDVGPLVDVQPDFVDGEVVTGELAQGPMPTRENPEVVVNAPKDDLDEGDRLAANAQRLAEIRAAEKLDDDDAWADYVLAATGQPIGDDGTLTGDQVAKLISIFDADAAK